MRQIPIWKVEFELNNAVLQNQQFLIWLIQHGAPPATHGKEDQEQEVIGHFSIAEVLSN